jgi:hypothetical protein
MQEFFSCAYIVCFTFSVIIFSPYFLPHNLNLQQSLRMSGDIPPLLLFAFMD